MCDQNDQKRSLFIPDIIILIIAALKVSIGVTYPSPDQYPHYSPPNFRAASPVTLRCMVEGASGSVEYRWSSTCSSCFASNSYSASISEQFLRSKDSGEHTCTIRDSAGNSGSYTQEMNIVGKYSKSMHECFASIKHNFASVDHFGRKI